MGIPNPLNVASDYPKALTARGTAPITNALNAERRRETMNLPAGLNEAGLISALAIVIGVVAYSFAGGLLPAFSYSQYIYPLLGVAIVAIGIHMDHALGDVGVGFGAALAGATLKGILPSSVP